MDLVIDIGNSRGKLGLFNGPELVDQGTVVAGAEVVRDWLNQRRPGRIAIGATGDAAGLEDALAALAPVTVLHGSSPTPLTSGYTTPATLGVDRMANAVAAMHAFPGRPTLAIDLGTCITFDLVDPKGHYVGGAISPGMRMRARAMHEHSARLPEVDASVDEEVMGTTTTGSLLAGIHQGIRHELAGWIADIRYQWPGLAVVLTGGDAPRFARALKSGIFADPSLTLRGLHALLEFQSPSSPSSSGPPRR